MMNKKESAISFLCLASSGANGQPLTPSELKEALTYVRTQREPASPFDVVFAGETPADFEQAAKTILTYASARVTWWLEGIWT